MVPVTESIGENFDTEEIKSDLEQSLYSITGDIDTAFRLDSESDKSTIEDKMTKEEELKKHADEYTGANNDSKYLPLTVSEGDTLQFLIEVAKTQI